jgi:hypothetical protein
LYLILDTNISVYFKSDQNIQEYKGVWRLLDSGSYSKITQTANSINSKVEDSITEMNTTIQ